jgi:hypothetical protein
MFDHLFDIFPLDNECHAAHALRLGNASDFVMRSSSTC